jgi:DNA primase
MNPQDMIQELIRKTGNEAESIIANGLGMQKKGNNYKCPSSHNHKSGDKNPSMGWDNNRYFFNCFGCGENIDIYTYYKNYCNYSFNDIMIDNGIKTLEEKRMSFMQEIKSKWKLPTNEHLQYINTRGISTETAKKFKVGSIDDGIALPYRKNGILTGVKIRSLNTKEQGNRMKSITGSKFFFFNYDNIDLEKPVIICEGEFDCMTLVELGYNAVSVGCGANSLSALFEQSDIFFNQVNEFIILGDNDENGVNMELKFIERLNEKAAVIDKSLYLGEKDVNDLYIKHGADAVANLIKSGKQKFDGEWDIDEEPYTQLQTEGYKFISTGIPTIDLAINQIQSKTVTLITGRSNAGKSTYVNQIVGNAVNQRKKVYYIIGEGDKDKIVNKWYSSLIGNNKAYYDTRNFNLKKIKEPKEQVLKAIQKWHKGFIKFYIKAMGKDKTTEQLFNLIEASAKKGNYDLIVADNLMSLLSVSKSAEKNEEQAKFIERCHSLAVAYNVAIIVVLHPNKTYSRGQDMDFEHISGSGDISNKADVILAVVRYKEGDDKYKENVENQIQVLKNRDWSELPYVDCQFNPDTYTYAELDINKKPLSNIACGWKRFMSNEELKKLELDYAMEGVKEFEQITTQEDISPFL